MPEAKDTKLVMFHCPEDVRAEMDALCEHNMIDRTEFLLQAIYKMMDFLESKQDEQDTDAETTYPDQEEDVLFAAEDSSDDEE